MDPMDAIEDALALVGVILVAALAVDIVVDFACWVMA